ncbi:MAG: GntR family transcriptional regulator [Blastocatellia bacterium]
MNVSFQKVEPLSKKVRVVAVLKEAILSGALKPGAAMVEAKLAQQFGVGQGLIREALIELEYQGFVERTPFSGTQVINLSLEDTQQIFAVRLELEPLAYKLAAEKAKSADLAALAEMVAAMKRYVMEENMARFFEANLACRRKIWEVAGNPFLARTLERLVAPLFALYVITETFNHEAHLQVSQRSVTIQEAAVNAIQAGAAEEAGRLAREFLQETQNNLHLLLAAKL